MKENTTTCSSSSHSSINWSIKPNRQLGKHKHLTCSWCDKKFLFHGGIYWIGQIQWYFIYKSKAACIFKNSCSDYPNLVCNVTIKQISSLCVWCVEWWWISNRPLLFWPVNCHRSSWRLPAASRCWVCRRWGYQLLRIPRREFVSWQSPAHIHGSSVTPNRATVLEMKYHSNSICHVTTWGVLMLSIVFHSKDSSFYLWSTHVKPVWTSTLPARASRRWLN